MIKVPDIGGAEDVEVIEVNVAVGDHIEAEQTLIVLESDKASMEVPAPQAGVVKAISVSQGDKVAEGSDILTLTVAENETGGGEEERGSLDEAVEADNSDAVTAGVVAQASEQEPAAETGAAEVKSVTVPDLGGAADVEVIEVNVAVGDPVEQDATLLVLESDKASMELPSPFAGVVKSLAVNVNDKVNVGDLIAELEVESRAEDSEAAVEPTSEKVTTQENAETPVTQTSDEEGKVKDRSVLPASGAGSSVYAGPAVRLMARELGVDLAQVPATGPRGRIVKEDVQAFVKKSMAESRTGAQSSSVLPAVPEIDFSAFGDVEEQPLSRIQTLTANAMQRSWLNVPHVAHFDEADISDLEEFRAQNKDKAKKRNLKLTFLPFLLKACAVALREHPQFNASLSPSGERLIYKKYCHIGIAMDTPAGLMVPVIRDVDQKGIWELAEEMTALGEKGQEGKLSKADIEGGCFTISSLGAIGGTGFTPIVNTPELAILGVSKTQIKPVYMKDEFVPRKMLPLTMCYDHRAVNGVDAGKFMTCLTKLLADIRRLVM